ncbi:Uncharacterised protein [Klebsiella pneumoniae]|nr:Uncharacterised protein [Klebsiella pneumoniae]
MRQITDRALGGDLRRNMVVKQRQQPLHHVRGDARFAVTEVGNGGADNRPSLHVAQYRTNAAGVAHQGIARQLAQLIGFQNNVAQRAKPGVDAIGNLPFGDDQINDLARGADALPGGFT